MTKVSKLQNNYSITQLVDLTSGNKSNVKNEFLH